jgi:hypothetical protein
MSVSADGLGSVYIGGLTEGDLNGTNEGEKDAFVAKYDDAGNLQWTRQFGTSAFEEILGVSADGLGNVYVTGETLGSLAGLLSGTTDGFVRKYDDAGNELWTRQFGSDGSDDSRGISVDGLGNVFISGYTSGSFGGPFQGVHDAFVTTYDQDGNHLWTRQFGTSDDDYGHAVSADGMGNVYFAGEVHGSLGGPNLGGVDAFVAKIPEPNTLVLAVWGLAVFPFVRRRSGV